MPTTEILDQAREKHVAGELDGARELYLQALQSSPGNAGVCFSMGVLEWQRGAFEEALTWLDRAIAISGEEPRHRYVRGLVLTSMGRTHDAIQAYRAVLNIEPGHLDALNAIANAYRAHGDVVAAEACYRRILALSRDAQALTNLGTLLQAEGRHEEALTVLREAAYADPGSPVCLLNLGVGLHAKRDFAQAAALFKQVLDLDPQFPEAAYNLANTLQAQRKLADAAACYQHALALNPDHADAYNNLGNVYRETKEYEAAATAFEAAIRLRPTFVAAYNNYAALLRALGRMDEAAKHLHKALELDSKSSVTHNNLGNILKDSGRLEEGIGHYRRAVECDPGNTEAHSNLVYAMLFLSEDADPVIRESERWSAFHETPLLAAHRPHANDVTPDRRLRIGYVSPDFRDHCQALFILPLFSNHDHARFEIICYSSVRRPDAVTQTIASYADRWREVEELDDEQLASMIRADGIDILIDLTMHMADGRPLLFCRKPAPVQIAWLAYPGTTGIKSIDYRLTDPCLDPPTDHIQYAEQILHLDDTFWCYDPLTDKPDVNALPALANGHITFGCLNNPCKLSDRTLQMWNGVMQRISSAKLLLMIPPGGAREHTTLRLEQHGIAKHRIRYAAFRPRADYLNTYHEIDLCLDTFPYNGHTTSLDSMWMGVPVVTRIGGTAAGRAGYSQLSKLGLEDLAARTDEEFIDLAVHLASDPARLSTLRESMRQRMTASPLMDGARFARSIERVYRLAWQTWCERPNLNVAPLT